MHFLKLAAAAFLLMGSTHATDLERIKYNNPGLKVDLGVGLWAWPMPVDWDGDGDLDLVVDSPCKPYNGIWSVSYTHLTLPTICSV